MTTKNEMDEILKRMREQNRRGRKFMEEEKYLVRVVSEGSCAFGMDKMLEDDYEMKVMSLDEIVDALKFLEKPFWTHSVGLTKKQVKEFPNEEKRWGIHKSIQIVQPYKPFANESIGGEN
tara:strand:- start:76 stop:435 length:360 start_codon:yes stop_codon:yes gene_type:complete